MYDVGPNHFSNNKLVLYTKGKDRVIWQELGLKNGFSEVGYNNVWPVTTQLSNSELFQFIPYLNYTVLELYRIQSTKCN